MVLVKKTFYEITTVCLCLYWRRIRLGIFLLSALCSVREYAGVGLKVFAKYQFACVMSKNGLASERRAHRPGPLMDETARSTGTDCVSTMCSVFLDADTADEEHRK